LTARTSIPARRSSRFIVSCDGTLLSARRIFHPLSGTASSRRWRVFVRSVATRNQRAASAAAV
jgi:hypothetical protein